MTRPHQSNRRRRAALAMATFAVGVATSAVPARAEPAPAGAQPVSPAPKDRPGDDGAAVNARLAKLEAQIADLTAKGQRAELAAQAAAQTPVDVSAYEEKLRVYGFMDMGYQRTLYSDRSPLAYAVPSRASTFALGDINLYVDAHPFERWRALLEVRLTNYPDGTPGLTASTAIPTAQSTATFDVNSANGGWSIVKWGGIVLERAWIQWTGWDWLAARVGLFPTPFGIWNVDHGTPTLIALSEPYFLVKGIFPRQQLGINLTGKKRLAPWTLEYNAYLTNGRTPGQIDLVNNKAFGGRLVASTSVPVPIAVGISGYYGNFAQITTTVASLSPFLVTRQETVGYTEGVFGADASVDVKGFRLRSEFALSHLVYAPGEHDSWYVPGTTYASRNYWGLYGLAAYQLPFCAVEPYVFAEVDDNLAPIAQGVMQLSGGLNVHVNPFAQIKLQYSRFLAVDFTHTGIDRSKYATDLFAARVVLAF